MATITVTFKELALAGDVAPTGANSMVEISPTRVAKGGGTYIESAKPLQVILAAETGTATVVLDVNDTSTPYKCVEHIPGSPKYTRHVLVTGDANYAALVDVPVTAPDPAWMASMDALIASLSGTSVPDATTGTKGKLQLAGDLAGTAALPTVPGLRTKPIRTVTASTTLALGDCNGYVVVNTASAASVTIPPNTGTGSVAFPVGSEIRGIISIGAGTTTIADNSSGTPVTIYTLTRYEWLQVVQLAANVWATK